jgi:serine protease inhibitor
MNQRDEIKVNIPLFLRLLEYAKEDAKDDMDLHRIVENITDLSRMGNTLSMKDYQTIVGPQENIEEIKLWQLRAGILK